MNPSVLSDRICVIIPTYNNAQTVGEVISGVLTYTEHVLVVNDGSTDHTSEVVAQYPQITLISYQKNVGKGWALRQGFEKAVALGYTHAITIDADGQHFPEDLPSFYNAVEKQPDAIIVGARNMDQASVPGKSSFGNKFSNFWFKVETGIDMTDTQSGYRAYPIRLLKDIRFFTKKYEFEIEVLVRAAWRGIAVEQTPVRVYYAPKEERISHFRPFQDFSRISVLNTFLVTIAFLYIKPRDFIRSLKKKMAGSSYGNNYSIPKNPIA
jgi:glycosyltransferase involved in cell wall biosynthesis